jgi:repressor LexA
MKGVTKRQREIVNFIKEFIQSKQYSPSYREIMSHFGFSSLGSVYKHMVVLKRRGMLTAEKSVKRSIVLSPEGPSITQRIEIELPLIGNISAGSPIETFPKSQMIAVPEYMVQAPENTYVLRAKDDTLSEEMIAEGDFIIVESRREAQPGDMIIGLINRHDTIVKRYYPEGQYVRLTGFNAHQPIIIREKDITVQAVVMGLLRLFCLIPNSKNKTPIF